ncbi:MAG: hypothetical protein IKC32_00235 [Clostridia bacterium]|nr:hypothetical protein [Clostridia bacterium]
MMDGSKIILAAHRGDRASFPENTMPAFRSALDFGADMIETDVRETKDGELVLIHDRSALRTAGVDVNVDGLTLEELRRLDASFGFGEEHRGTPIPTVRELMELIAPTDMTVNWEIKVYPKDFGAEATFALVDKLVSLIDDYGLSERSMINSFSDLTLEYFKNKYGDLYPIHGQGIDACRRSNDVAEMPREELYDWCCLYPEVKGERVLDYPGGFDYCRKHGIIPCVCIKDDEEDYGRAIELGCRMFTTNDMRECARILKALGHR